jgi:hypothetical protein
MSINVKVKMNLKFPKINLQEHLLIIMDRVIKGDIVARIRTGINISDGPHKQTSDAWRKEKLLRGLRADVPLIASGQLQSSFKIEKVGKTGVVMFPSGIRVPYQSRALLSGKRRKRATKIPAPLDNNTLADILQNQGLKDGTTYEFFGISDRAEQNAMSLMNKLIRRDIENAK